MVITSVVKITFLKILNAGSIFIEFGHWDHLLSFIIWFS